jgi:hypothetical protein
MVYRYVFHNGDYQEEKHNQVYKMYMLIHLMMYNSNRIHDMEDIETFVGKDKILANMLIHMYDIEDKDNRLLDHMICIDRIENHCMSNILNDILDT